MSTTNLKTSLLVEGQVPEFVREEYPLFISFLEAYYEFLETKQGTQKNDLIEKAKDLRYISDVDYSIDEFESSFINNFAALLPKDTSVDKAFIIKNILPLYLARGNQKSFEFLFRLLYGTEVIITYPKDNILRASDGKWTIESAVRIDNNVYSYYIGNGTTKTFFLAQQVTESDVTVFLDNVETTSGFYILKESKKIVFETAPGNNVAIKVEYDNFDENLFTNKKITGLTSGATAVVERASPRLITQQTSIELYISPATLLGSFINAETITTEIFADDGETLITIRSDTVATLSSITILDGGASYNIGDPVTIIGGAPQIQAEAVVEQIATGFPDGASLGYGGAGFEEGSLIKGTKLNDSGIITLAIGSIDSSGANTANTFTIYTDVIEDYESVLISASDYGFPSNVIPTGENASTRIADALERGTYTNIGPITNVVLLFANTTANNILIEADGAKLANVDIKSFRTVGRIDILNGGQNYKVGDEITFGPNPPMTYGIGLAAAVTSVGANGKITKVELQPHRVMGTANVNSGEVTVIGTGTSFDTELVVGDLIMINSESRYVNSITSATSFNVNVAFTRTSTNLKVGVYDRFLIGGENFVQNNFPTASVSSATGTNAVVEITSNMGDGEEIGLLTTTVAGEIRKIRITNPGAGYQFVPTIDLAAYGDGNATAEAQIERSYVSFPGKWTTSDSIISSFDRKIEGLDYYIDFTYVTSVATEFSKYAEILKGLLHPAGFKNYAEYPIDEVINIDITVEPQKSLGVSGTVSTNSGSITVTGTSTRFNVANSSGIITIGTQISINNEVRTINSIISNTSLTVSSAFTNNSSAQPLIIIT